MWKSKRCIFLKERRYLVYSAEDGDEIIFIPIEKEIHGAGVVYFKSSLLAHRKLRITCMKQEGDPADHYSIEDTSLDVLKLKCLIKAKDLGWNINLIKGGE